MRVNLQHHEKPFWRLFTASFSNPVCSRLLYNKLYRSCIEFRPTCSSSQEYPYEINLSTSAFKSSYILRIDNIPTYQPSFLTHNIYIFSPSFKKEIYTNDDCLLILLEKNWLFSCSKSYLTMNVRYK